MYNDHAEIEDTSHENIRRVNIPTDFMKSKTHAVRTSCNASMVDAFNL